MAQVHNKVNGGVMDGVVYGGMMEAAEPEDEEYEIGMEDSGPEPYGHVVSESTDSVTFNGGRLTCYDMDAVPFISFIKKDGSRTKMFVGVNGELHSTMPAVLLSNGDIRKDDFGSLWDIKKDEERSGRVWITEECTVISFYSYPKSPKKIYDYCVEALMAVQDSTGKDFNIGEVMVDLWTKSVRNTVIMPVRWFNNGMADMFLPIVEKCEPYEDFDWSFRYRITTSKGIFTADWKGDDIKQEQDYGALYESKEKSKKIDYNKYIKSLINFMREQHLRIDPLPEIELNPEEQNGIFVKTGYYDPYEKKIVVFTDGRHPKDILRTVAHEFIHHMQNLQNPNKDWGTGGNLEDDRTLRDIEGEAFLLGNIIFREWTEKMKKTGELNESKKRKKQVKNDKGELVPETCDKCGGKVVCQIHGEPVYVCKDCGKYFGTMPCKINESPDRVVGIDARWRDKDAIPFLTFTDDYNFYIGTPSQSHVEVMKDIGVSEEEADSIDEDNFEDYVVLAGTGRYWSGHNIISFWDSPIDNWSEARKAILQLINKGIIKNPKHLLIDCWCNDEDWLVPYRWFVNGTLKMLLDMNVRDIEPGDYINGQVLYVVVLKNGERHYFDVEGNFVENKYQQYALTESINVKKALKDLKKRRDPDGIEDWDRLDEIESEIVEPDDVDLSSFNIKKHLNPKFWDDGHLDTRIRLKLLDIADDFFDSLGVDWVEPEDVIITGSLANYNWNEKYSDIDLHILVDYEDVDERVDFVREYFTLKKNEWNEKHKGIRIFGFPVEVYVQDANEPHASSGVYSIDRDEWITEPDINKIRSGKVDKRHVREMISTYMNKIDCLIDIYKHHKDDVHEMEQVANDAAEIFDEIKTLRKEDLAKYGKEMCDGNIIFKALRRSDYIGKLIKLKNLAYDKINSL